MSANIFFALITWAFIIAGALIPSYWIAAIILAKPRDQVVKEPDSQDDTRLSDIIGQPLSHHAKDYWHG